MLRFDRIAHPLQQFIECGLALARGPRLGLRRRGDPGPRHPMRRLLRREGGERQGEEQQGGDGAEGASAA